MATTPNLMRVGVVVRGALVCERVVDAHRGLSVGTAADATLRLESVDGAPHKLEVLRPERGELLALSPAAQQGRLRMRRGGEGHLAPPGVPVPLRGQGGSLAVGDVLVLFQPTAPGTPLRTHREPVLHLGMVFEDRLIDDRTWPLNRPIRVGNARRDTVVLPLADYAGPPLTLTPQRDGSVLLQAPADAGLRLAGPDSAPQTQEALLSAGLAERRSDLVQVRLQLGSRVRLRLGAHTLLVQVVMQTVTVPQLPRHSVVDRLVASVLGEPAWWASLAASALLLGSLAVQAHRTYADPGLRPPAPAEAAPDPVDYAPEVPLRELAKATEPEKTAADSPETPPAQVQLAPRPSKAKTLATGPQVPKDPVAAGPARRPLSARESMEARSVAGQFVPSAPRIYADAAEGAPGDLAKPLFAGGSRDAESAPAALPPGRAAAATASHQQVAVRTSTFGPRDERATRSAGPEHRDRPLPPMPLPTGPDIDEKPEIGRIVARKNAAIQRCYDQALRENPSEGGKVRVTFTVGTEGTITEVSVAGGSAGLAECIEARFVAIRGLPVLKQARTFVQTYVLSRAE